jgi:hypothetical protein
MLVPIMASLIEFSFYFTDENQIKQQHFGVAHHGLPFYNQLIRDFSGANNHNYHRHDTENGR